MKETTELHSIIFLVYSAVSYQQILKYNSV